MTEIERIPGIGEGATDRFVIQRRLGKGGMGVVYEAYDQDRSLKVALKTLSRVNPASLYRFKREFRLLANVSHPNLVALYELVSIDDQWFFTMEYVDGIDFLSYVRGGVAGAVEPTATVPPTPAIGDLDTRDITRDVTPTPAPADFDRIRSALGQLADGVHALHATGHLHRDIKPSNILVTEAGRVVLLDFGVITELAGARWQSDVVEMVGTPAYMAPELGEDDGTATAASDWYSVGVVLYEALTGRRPLPSSAALLRRAGKPVTAVPATRNRPDIPPDLAELAMRLLAADPADRPTGAEILAVLGHHASPATTAPPPAAAESEFVGRNSHRARLREAFAATQRGAGVAVYVRGGSGMGKTALVRDFLDAVSRDEQVVVLAGRCYERESVPYKAIDSLVDSLAHHLLSLPRHAADALLPRDILLLARVFPVLQRVEAIAQARRRSAQTPDDLHELKRRAFAALRELLTRIAEQRPLVIFIDDLQWGDVDSAPFLGDLMRPPEAPPLLLIAVYRSEDASSPILRALLRRDARLGSATNWRTIEVEALSGPEALELAARLLEADPEAEAARAIASESHGNPFFIHELARFVKAQGQAPLVSLSLDAVIRSRVADLAEPTRRLLEIVAVAGRPLPRAIVERAAQIAATERAPVVELGAAHLIRTSGSRDNDVIEPYHSRIRETIVAALPEETRRRHHLQLAIAIETSDRPDPETLTDHFRAAGDFERAAEYATAAARQAAAALAFDRASRLYRVALEIGEYSADETRELNHLLGEALANAGRGPESAETFLLAAEGAPPAVALERKRNAALQYVKAGHMDTGIALLREVLAAAGFRLAATPRRALLPLLRHRIQLRLRGLGFRPRDVSEIPPRKLTEIDVCWSAAVALGMVDTFRGADFQTRQLILALRAGDLYRIARALCFEIAFRSVAGHGSREGVLALIERTRSYADQLDRPEIHGFVSATSSLSEYLAGNFRVAEEQARIGIKIFRNQCTGVQYEWASTELYLLWSLHYRGKLTEMATRLQFLLNEAEERGDLYAATSFRTGPQHIAWLLADDPAPAYADAEAAAESRAAEGFHLQNYWVTYALSQCDLYSGQPEAGYRRICDAWDHLKKVLVFRIQFCRLEAMHLRARAALAAAAVADDPAPLIRDATRIMRRIRRAKVPWAAPLAELLAAGLAMRESRTGQAIERLRAAEHALEAAGMDLYLALTRRRLGQLTGAAGAEQIEAADQWLAEQGVANPARFAALFVPGFPSVSDPSQR